MKHCELFKISRESIPQLNCIKDRKSTDETPGVEGENEYNDLIQQLRQMESCDEDEYKTRVHRLVRQWHPDKNPEKQEQATKFFRIIKRHWETFQSNKDFSWLDIGTLDFENEELVSPPHSGVQQSTTSGWSWVNEYAAAVAEEIRLEKSAVSEANRRSTNPRNIMVTASTSKREFCFKKADAMWQCAIGQERVSMALLDGREYPSSVWHAQQAAEMMIKSLMFRTCGITESELKGKGAHNLVSLFGRIECKEEDWPVALGDLEFLSTVYFNARYPMGDMSTLPWQMHGLPESALAQRAIEALKKWVVNKNEVRMPDSEEGCGVTIVKSESGPPEQISLEPAPLKSSSAATSSLPNTEAAPLAPAPDVASLEVPMRPSEICSAQLELTDGFN